MSKKVEESDLKNLFDKKFKLHFNSKKIIQRLLDQ